MKILLHIAVFLLAVAGTLVSPATAQVTGSSNPDKADKISLPATVTDPSIGREELAIRLVPLTKDQLAAVASRWRTMLQQKTTDVLDTQIAILNEDGKSASAARERLTSLVAARNDLYDKFIEVIDAWARKNGDAKTIADYRAYQAALVIGEARATDLRTMMSRFGAWLTDRNGGVKAGIKLGIVVASFAGLLLVAGMTRRLTRRWIGRVRNISKLLQAFFVTVIYWLVLAFGLMVVLSALGVDVTPLFALIGGASFILAFAFQDTLSNLASGLMIMTNRPFDEGDYVDVGGVAGTVKSVSIVATTVTTPDNQVIVIPNKQVWGAVITNVTVSPTRRVDLVFGIGYGDSITKAQEVLEATVSADPLVLADPSPMIRVSNLGENSVDFIVRPWVRSEDYWTVYWDLTRKVKEAFDENGISIPFPQRDVHLIQAPTQVQT